MPRDDVENLEPTWLNFPLSACLLRTDTVYEDRGGSHVVGKRDPCPRFQSLGIFI